MKDEGRMATIAVCRVCEGKSLHRFLSLGSMPLANGFVRAEQLGMCNDCYPLDVCFCGDCGLVQLEHVVAPEIMFKEYSFLTGASEPARLHFAQLARGVIQKFGVPPGSLVIDIGSNDGTLLQSFKLFNMRVLGIEPATNVAELAASCGIETINSFFTERLAQEVRAERGRARVITAANVFAHVHDLGDLLRGVNCLLADDGVFVIEVPYLVDMIDKLEFDTIYHEHLSYFSMRPLAALFANFNMNIMEVERLGMAGGSIRVFVDKSDQSSSPSVDTLLKLEAEKGLYSTETYLKFAPEVSQIKEMLLSLLYSLKAQGATIIGYGAPAKGNVLLNYCKIGTDVLDYIIDTTPFKQGCYSPGMHIPVLPESQFHEKPPDFALLLAWNYADAILSKEEEYQSSGGKFIIPIPKPRLV